MNRNQTKAAETLTLRSNIAHYIIQINPHFLHKSSGVIAHQLISLLVVSSHLIQIFN